MEFENLIKLIRAVSDSELTELKYEADGVKLNLSKKKEKVQPSGNMAQSVLAAVPDNMGADTAPDTSAQTACQAAQPGNLVQSPLVGTFYAAPAEDAASFVSVGDRVKKGQTLAIVEAMKLMNEIESEYDGTVAEILVENGQPVEYGQSLFRIV